MWTVVSVQRLVYRSHFKHLVQLFPPNVCEKDEDGQECRLQNKKERIAIPALRASHWSSDDSSYITFLHTLTAFQFTITAIRLSKPLFLHKNIVFGVNLWMAATLETGWEKERLVETKKISNSVAWNTNICKDNEHCSKFQGASCYCI